MLLLYMRLTVRVGALQMINEYFGVGVTSEAMDGAAPELNPGWVHRRNNTHPEVRHTHDYPGTPAYYLAK